MAETLYKEERKGYAPQVQGLGGGSIAVNWTPQGPQNTFESITNVLSQFLDAQRKAAQKKQEDFKNQYSMYNSLRESGYDPVTAYEAVKKYKMPKSAALYDPYLTKQEKGALDNEKTRADIAETQAKTDSYKKYGTTNLYRVMGSDNNTKKIDQYRKLLDQITSARGYRSDPKAIKRAEFYKNKIDELTGAIEENSETETGNEDDPVVRTGIDQESGRKVGQTKSGKIVFLS